MMCEVQLQTTDVSKVVTLSCFISSFCDVVDSFPDLSVTSKTELLTMGACSSSNKKGSAVERTLSSVIGRELDKDKTFANRHKKILFLGSGGTGKSTIYKQLKQIHGEGFTDDDRKEFTSHIHAQIINEMTLAFEVVVHYNLRREQREKKENSEDQTSYDDPEDELLIFDEIKLESAPLSNMSDCDTLLNYTYNRNSSVLDTDIFNICKSLWDEPIIKEIYDKRNITMIETSSAYFWDQIDIIQNSSYLPTEQDILLCRFKTTGIYQIHFFLFALYIDCIHDDIL